MLPGTCGPYLRWQGPPTAAGLLINHSPGEARAALVSAHPRSRTGRGPDPVSQMRTSPHPAGGRLPREQHR